ncbi:DUF960 family protein [Oceanobacillus damuensis]|uniref:DUF960 family protein n=1 Tax=Oceanobacillus damuensis TaxID=937928 RepID=UPI0008340AB4|nr:DUF960 family protein [Oceanobacillus damuensis]
MIEQRKSRYVTRAINDELNIEIQALLWGLWDSIAVNRKDKMDYLQVFEIVTDGKKLKVMNRQEQPAMSEELVIEQCSMEISNIIVWIIDELNKQTMLLPSDY